MKLRVILTTLATLIGTGALHCFPASAAETSSEVKSEVKVVLPEDEFILPPYLVDFQGGSILNVKGEEGKRSAHPKEWLDHADEFDLPARLALYGVSNERTQWVAGGVLKATLGKPVVGLKEIPYQFYLHRGWVKVWIKNKESSVPFRIHTPNVQLVMKNAVFWMTHQKGKTEVYLLSGEIHEGGSTSTGRMVGPQYFVWKAPNSEVLASTNWSEVSLLSRLQSSFPELLELTKQAEEKWRKDQVSTLYSELRKKGWRKASRLAPTPTPEH